MRVSWDERRSRGWVAAIIAAATVIASQGNLALAGVNSFKYSDTISSGKSILVGFSSAAYENRHSSRYAATLKKLQQQWKNTPRTRLSLAKEQSSRSTLDIEPNTLLFEITAFSPTVSETDNDPLTMASGQKVRVGAIAADLRILPFGSLVRVKGYNNNQPCIVLDTGGDIKGYKLDLFMWHESDAIKWGRQKNVSVEILRIGW